MIKVTKQIHKGWQEWEKIRKSPELQKQFSHRDGLFGKWQFIFRSKKGEISLIQLKDYWKQGEDLWEIYELSNNNLFQDVERFKTKKEAERKIKKLL